MGKWLSIALACGFLLACATEIEEATDAGKGFVKWELNPLGMRDARVVAVETRGPYALATLHGRNIDLRFFVPLSDDCARVLTPGAHVSYSKSGSFGLFSSENGSCEPVGTASLREWLARGPRRRGRPLPRGTARYRVFYADEGVVLARGSFPYANRLGFLAHDIVAMFPNSEVCQRAIQRGEATIEFRDGSRVPYWFSGESGICPISGFALPLPEAPSAE
ncbi:MAG: hypothetical protein JRH01_14340 [Deltaproteobacteria bacterium]|nr:hypothetical protein [Deltaproteobacteria bacterium]MBW2418984.1 hypothetical protein [Deltaproteobacteria bacterium]